MKYELDLNDEQYQRLVEVLEKARQAEVNNVQDITDTNAFSEASALSRIQDALATQHSAPEQPRGTSMTQVMQGAFQRAFDANEESLDTDRAMSKPIDAEPERGITPQQLKFELDKVIEKLDELDSWTPEYEASDRYKSALGEVMRAKNFGEAIEKDPHPDANFHRTVWEAVEKHGDGDYGITDLNIGEGYMLRSTYSGGRIFQNGETIADFESPYTDGGVAGPLEVEGNLAPEQKEFILSQIQDLDKDMGRDEPLPPGYSRTPAAFAALIDRIQQERGVDELESEISPEAEQARVDEYFDDSPDVDELDHHNSELNPFLFEQTSERADQGLVEVSQTKPEQGGSFFQRAAQGIRNVAKLAIPGSAEVEQALADEHQLSTPEAIKYKWELQQSEENGSGVDLDAEGKHDPFEGWFADGDYETEPHLDEPTFEQLADHVDQIMETGVYSDSMISGQSELSDRNVEGASLLEQNANVSFFVMAQSAAFDHGSMGQGEIIYLDLPDGHKISTSQDSVIISKEVNGESTILYEQDRETCHLPGNGETFRDKLSLEVKAAITAEVQQLDHRALADDFGVDLDSEPEQEISIFDMLSQPPGPVDMESMDAVIARDMYGTAVEVIEPAITLEDTLPMNYEEEIAAERYDSATDLDLTPEPGSRDDVLDAARYIAKEMGESDYSGGRSIETDSFKIETYGNEVKVFDQDGNKVIEADQSSGQELYRPTPDLVGVLTESANELEQQEIAHNTPEVEVDGCIEIDDD